MRDVSCAAVGSGSDKATDDVSDGGTGDFRDEAAGDLLDEAEGLAALAFAFPLPFAFRAPFFPLPKNSSCTPSSLASSSASFASLAACFFRTSLAFSSLVLGSHWDNTGSSPFLMRS